MSLVEAFRFPFYRIFFSVVVGIIALEGFVLSYNYNEDRKITDGVLIRIIEPDSPQELPLPGQIEIPFAVKKFKESNSQGAKFDIRFSKSTESITPKFKFTGGFVIKSDPVLVLENRPDIVIRDHWLFLKFKSWNVIILFIYLLIATLTGEFFCALGDLIIGLCFFNFDPCSCDTTVESCSPIDDRKISVEQILTNEAKRDFSELHFSISRLFAGLTMVSLTLGFTIRHQIIFILILICLLIIICLSTTFNPKTISNPGFFKFSTRLCLSIIMLLGLIISGEYLILQSIPILFVSFMIFLILSITFRIQANKILRS